MTQCPGDAQEPRHHLCPLPILEPSSRSGGLIGRIEPSARWPTLARWLDTARLQMSSFEGVDNLAV